ncbi:MAG: T9SS type A sorting domain-containing protein [Saprospiraceae bacterium]
MKFFLPILFSFSFILLKAQTTFIEDTQNNFTGVYEGEMEFADVDGDGDQDLFTLGYSDGFDVHGKLYFNDGNGIFTLANTDIPELGYASMAFADVDGDNDIDLLVAGQSGASGTHPSGTYLYLNDGNGNFTDANQSFTTVLHCSVGFADVDNDNDQDIFILGSSANLSGAITEMYLNNGDGVYSLSANNFTLVYQGAFDFADVDGDDDLDVLVTGTSLGGNFDPISTLYKNDGNGSFTEFTGSSFIGVNISTVDFADIDSDGDNDVLITGSSSNGLSTYLYKNDGDGNFTLNQNTGLVKVIFGDSSFGDVDLDGDLDLIIAGRKGAIPDETAKLYFNDGDGNFTESTSSTFTGATGSSLDFADVDGDNDLDLFIMGVAPDDIIYSKLYINDLMVGNENPALDFQVKIYPNPFSDFVFLDLEKNIAELTIEVSNSIGQILQTNQFQNISQIEIPTSTLSNGIYFLKITDENGQSEIFTLAKTDQ